MKIFGFKVPVFYRVFDKKHRLTGIINKAYESNLTENQWLQVVTCFVINENNEVLIEKRVNKGLSPGMLDLCSGHMDDFEAPTQTMLRELEEELGIDRKTSFQGLKKASQEPLKLIFISNGKKRGFFTYFYCLKLKDENYKIKIQREEIESIKWIPLEECFEIIRKGKTRFPKSDSAYENVFKVVSDICFGRPEEDKQIK